MKKQIKFKRLIDGLYQQKVWFVYDYVDDELLNFCRLYEKDYPSFKTWACGHYVCFAKNDEVRHFIAIQKRPKDIKFNEYLGLLHHEVMHATFGIMAEVGMKYSRESEEAYTYYSQMLFLQCVQAVLPKGIK